MTDFKTPATHWKDYLSLTAAALLAHGLVLLNDGNYVDGWHFNFFAEHGYWDKMKSWWYELGRPPGFWWVYLPFKNYFNIYLFKFLSFLPLLTVSFIQYYFLNRFTPLSRGSAWFVAAFTLCWPYYHMIAWGQYPDHFPPVWFYGGWLLYFLHVEKGGNPALKGLALLLIYVSFFYQAFLVLHYVIALVLLIYIMGYPAQLTWPEIRKQLPAFSKQHWLLLVIPFVFFFSKPYLFPSGGRYAGYFIVDLFSLKTLVFFLGGWVSTLFGPLAGLARYHSALPVLALGLMAGYFHFRRQPPQSPENEPCLRGPWLWVLGILLVSAIVYAHAANHKMALLLSYQARHSRQTGLGVALIALAGIHYLGQRWSHSNWPVKKFLMFGVLAALIFLNINIYLTYQAHWAKNKAVIHQLSQKQPLEGVNIYFLTNHLPMGMGVDYHYAEVTLTLYEAWGEERYLGVPPYLQKHRYDREWIGIVLDELKHGRNPIPAAEAYLNEVIPKTRVAQNMVEDWKEERGFRTGIKDFQPGGCMGEIIVRPVEEASEPSIALRYLWKRLFAPESLPAFYDTIAQVELKPLGIDATGNPCPAQERP